MSSKKQQYKEGTSYKHYTPITLELERHSTQDGGDSVFTPSNCTHSRVRSQRNVRNGRARPLTIATAPRLAPRRTFAKKIHTIEL